MAQHGFTLFFAWTSIGHKPEPLQSGTTQQNTRVLGARTRAVGGLLLGFHHTASLRVLQESAKSALSKFLKTRGRKQNLHKLITTNLNRTSFRIWLGAD